MFSRATTTLKETHHDLSPSVRHLFATSCAFLIALQTASAGPDSDCEWCGSHEVPSQLGAEATIAGPEEPGPRLVLTGTVYQPDGTTPAPDVLLYIYHTNAEGRYPTRGDETGNARRHGYLRAWVVTDDQGRYRVHTIKPGSYPGGDEPAHIHMTVTTPGQEEYWIDSVLFEGDPKITRRIRQRQDGRHGEGIVELDNLPDGTLLARRDVILAANESDD